MTKKRVGILIVIILLLSTCTLFYFSLKPLLSFEKFFGWEYLSETSSPDGSYILKAYRTNGGATVDFGIICQLTYTKENKDDFTIYHGYHESTAEVKWIDNTTVVINDRQLNVLTNHYDFRNDSKQ